MKKSFDCALDQWNWKSQFIGEEDNKKNIPDLISKIETGFYQTQEVEIDLKCIDLTSYSFETKDLFDFIHHVNLVNNSNLDYPVIVNRKGHIIDWRHRLCKALIEWREKIKWIMIVEFDII